MNSIVLAYALRDEILAQALSDFLEINLPLSVSCTEAIVGPGKDLIEATEWALSADVALVLLSQSSVPKVWNRTAWEPVFFQQPNDFQTLLGFILVDDCVFPGLLRQQPFFDANVNFLAACRQIKQWLLRPLEKSRAAVPARPDPAVAPDPAAPDVEELRRAVADKPGTVAEILPHLAAQFAEECVGDFEAVYRFDCRGRSQAGILGDIGSGLGLRLPGTTEENAAMLREWCGRHRVLFVLAGVKAEDREFASPGGRASVIFTSTSEAELPGSIRSRVTDAVRRFEDSSRHDSATALSQGWIAVRLLKAQERFAEALEVLETLSKNARDLGDTTALLRIRYEKYWIRSDRGNVDGPVINRADGPGQEAQLPLPFGE